MVSRLLGKPTWHSGAFRRQFSGGFKNSHAVAAEIYSSVQYFRNRFSGGFRDGLAALLAIEPFVIPLKHSFVTSVSHWKKKKNNT